MTDLFSMSKAPAPQQSFSIFKSLDIDYTNQLVYHEIIPIIATGDKQESFDFRPFILENKITGEVFFQLQVSHYTNKISTPTTLKRRRRKRDTQTNIAVPEPIKLFDPLSIAFVSSGANQKNAEFLPIVKSSQPSLNTKELTTPYIGVIYLFPNDITNLIASIVKDPLAIAQMPFSPFAATLDPIIQESSNPSTPFNLSASSKKLYITLKNNQEEKIMLSFSPDDTSILTVALDFYVRLLQSPGKPL